MTTPDAVEALLAADQRLTDETRTALAELFRAAYEELTDDDPDNDLTTMAGVS